MNLVIDVGNSKTKIGVFYLNQLIYFEKVQQLTEKQIKLIDDLFKIDAVILFASGDHNNMLNKYLSQFPKFIQLDHTLDFPVKIRYQTPDTLGLDRLAGVIAAKYISPPKKNILTIDTGTCITFNFLSAENEFLGGSISPGIKLRFKAMHHFTSKLPLVDYKDIDYPELIGTDTASSLTSGVFNGLSAEIEQMITLYKNKYGDLTVFMTGGSKHIFEKRIKSKIFVVPHLVMFGLNKILNYNV